jgi:hypothetical protein
MASSSSPIASPVIPVHQFWHRRVHKDAASMWLREQVHSLFAGRQ